MLVILSVIAFVTLIYGCGEYISQNKKNSLDAEWNSVEDAYLDSTDRLRDKYRQLGVAAPGEW